MSVTHTKAAKEERQRKVAALYLRRVSQSEIAKQLGVNQATISRDLQVLYKLWRAEAASMIDEHQARELAELDQMEQDAAIQYSQTKRRDWLDTRLKIKERRAKLLGLDINKVQHTGEGGGPVVIRVVYDDKPTEGEA
jgi:transposase-like protein